MNARRLGPIPDDINAVSAASLFTEHSTFADIREGTRYTLIPGDFVQYTKISPVVARNELTNQRVDVFAGTTVWVRPQDRPREFPAGIRAREAPREAAPEQRQAEHPAQARRRRVTRPAGGLQSVATPSIDELFNPPAPDTRRPFFTQQTRFFRLVRGELFTLAPGAADVYEKVSHNAATLHGRSQRIHVRDRTVVFVAQGSVPDVEESFR